MNWEPVTPPFFLSFTLLLSSNLCHAAKALSSPLFHTTSFYCLYSVGKFRASLHSLSLCFFLLYKIQAVTVTNVWWLCSLAKEYTDIRLFNESRSCASHTSAAGSPNFKAFIGTGPYALVVQMLALAVLHTGMRMLISYTGSCVVTTDRKSVV